MLNYKYYIEFLLLLENIDKQLPQKWQCETKRYWFYRTTKWIYKIQEGLEDRRFDKVIEYSFLWDSSKEGHYYWKEIKKKLQNVYLIRPW